MLGARGAHYLDEGRVEGEDPLAPFGPNAARHVKRTDGFPHCPDIMVNSTYWDDTRRGRGVRGARRLARRHGRHAVVPVRAAPRGARAARRRSWSAPRPCTASCAAGSCSSATRSTRRSSVPGHDPLARRRLRDLERHVRHPARPHAGAGQARGDAGAARAPAPARGAAPDGARLGDAAAACARRVGRVRRRARPAHATRRWSSTATAARPGSRWRRTGRSATVTREVLAAVRELAGPVEIDPTPQEVPWTVPLDEDAEHAPTTPTRSPPTSPPRRRPRWCWPRSARPTAGARRRSTRGGARSTWP